MNKALPILTTFALSLGFFIGFSGEPSHAFQNNPPTFNASAPGMSSCNGSGCHNSFAVNAGDGSTEINVGGPGNTRYEAGETYSVDVVIVDPNAVRFGFQAVVLDASENSVGTLVPADDSKTQTTSGLDFIFHDPAQNATENYTYSFQWEAPDEDAGPVTFYATGNGSNGANGPNGDYVYSAQLALTFDPGVNVSVAEVAEGGFAVWPNPTSDRVSVEWSGGRSARLELFSITGRQVGNWTAEGGRHELNVGDLPAGLYWLHFNDGRQTITEKLIVR